MGIPTESPYPQNLEIPYPYPTLYVFSLNVMYSVCTYRTAQCMKINTSICTKLHCLFSVLIVLALRPSPLLLDHLHHPVFKLMIAPFGMLHLVSGINSLHLFVNLILVPVPPLTTHLLPVMLIRPQVIRPRLENSRPRTFRTAQGQAKAKATLLRY